MIDLSKLDEETLRLMKSYTNSNLEYKPKRIRVLDEWRGITLSLNEFNNEYRQAVDRIPHESRLTAIVELDGGYDGQIHFSIYYYRLETDKEWNDSMEKALKYAEETQRLKDKYGR